MEKKKTIKIILVVALLITGWIIWTNINFTTTHISIKDEKIPEGFSGYKIAEIADLHNHKWGDSLVNKIKEEQPDIIVITGDFVDSSHTDFDISMEFIEKVKSIAPIYYVTGNHEAWIDNYSELEKKLYEAEVHMMDDTSVLIEKDNSKINLIGIQDPDFVEADTFEGVQESIVKTKMQPLLDENYYNIVLCHRPELFKGYVDTGAELVLTGHAHGGQVRIPFAGGLVAPNQGFFPEYTEGVYHEKNTDMVVSRGLGNSIIPIRINNMPELVIVTLNQE